ACSTAVGSRLARKGIDGIRRSKGTALNQSSPSLAGASPWLLTRKVASQDDRLVLTDTLTFDRPVATGALHVLQGEGNRPMRLVPLASLVPDVPASLTQLVLVRSFEPTGRWRLVEARLGRG
ncbi:MAG TPA: hypothetical protein VN436_03365, partial [Holophaga sp.]|nr:hypothetical protein [Holophaga sp.]